MKPYLLMALLLPLGLSFSPLPETQCPHVCQCQRTIAPTQVAAEPPSCVDTGSLVAMIDRNSGNDGCCQDPFPGCNQLICRWKVIISVKANDGQTCNFKIKVPVGLEQDVTCNNASQCAHASAQIHAANCGHGETYQVRADGVTVWSIKVECEHCEGPK